MEDETVAISCAISGLIGTLFYIIILLISTTLVYLLIGSIEQNDQIKTISEGATMGSMYAIAAFFILIIAKPVISGIAGILISKVFEKQ